MFGNQKSKMSDNQNNRITFFHVICILQLKMFVAAFQLPRVNAFTVLMREI